MNSATPNAEIIKSNIISVVAYNESIGGRDLVNDVAFRTNADKDSIWEQIKTLYEAGEIKRVDFSTSSAPRSIRSIYFPKETTIFTQRKF